jgi:hypothetical protein
MINQEFHTMTNRGLVSAPARQPWRLNPVSEPLSRYRPVLAVTVLRRQDAGWEILAGVRTEGANATHSNVVSVPTLRVPNVVATSWIERLDDPDDTTFHAEGAALREVTNVLARKLGMADALELGRIRLEQLDLGVWQGTSVIGENEHGIVTEDLTMFNACVAILAGAELFPTHTASYNPLVWAPIPAFLRMVRTREVAHLGVGLDPIQFCAHGLCLVSTERMLAGWEGRMGDITRVD